MENQHCPVTYFNTQCFISSRYSNYLWFVNIDFMSYLSHHALIIFIFSTVITVSSASHTLLMILHPILKLLASANASFIKCTPYKLNSVGDMQNPISLFFRWFLFHWREASIFVPFVNCEFSFQLTPIFLYISTSLVQSTRSIYEEWTYFFLNVNQPFWYNSY
jgi:hypothetical protein